MDKVEKLYQNYEILAEAKEKIAENEKEYLEILQSVKGDYNEKRLASQFIARFFKSFPHLADKAIDAQLDLCEDDDMAIRKQAIKDLPSFCKDTKEYVPKIADVLAQMLQADDPSEIAIVHSSLMTIFKLDAKGTLFGLFAQIVGGEEITRKRAVKFLCTKVIALAPEFLTKELEEYMLEECKKLFQDVTGEEFLSLMSMLSSLKISKTIPGQHALLDIVVEQAALDKEFDYSASENIDCFLLCTRLALPYFSPFVSSAKFVNYICLQVIPVLNEIPPPVEGADICLEILKLLAEMTSFCVNLQSSKECLEIVYSKLLEYMPLPPMDDSTENSSPPTDEPTLQFSHIECLMYSFHQIAKHQPEFLTSVESADRLKDLKMRLQYLAQGIQGYIKKLREALQDKKADESKSEENKMKLIALRTTTNINSLIKDLFHNPPSYKCNIILSWKPNANSAKTSSDTSTSVPVKRKERPQITFNDSSKFARRDFKGDREIYSPPSGKYSTKVKHFQGSGDFSRRGQGYGRNSRGRGQRFY